jgi:hypothetical protein
MPKLRSSQFVSNLSLNLPRCIHRSAKVKALRSGSPSFAAYVALLLEQAPERITAAQLIRTHAIELLTKATSSGAANGNHPSR